jgi:biopolymer transport protein TolR
MNAIKAEMNVAPLIDVLLVLLIIFMVAAPVTPARWEAKTPQKPQSTAVASDELLVVTLGVGGSLALNSTSLGIEELAPRLSAELAGRSDKTVILKAPRKLPYASVSAVVDTIEGAGAEPLGLQIDFLE